MHGIHSVFMPPSTKIFDRPHKFSNFSASCEPIFKIPDAMCRKIDALSIFGALHVIDQTFAPHAPPQQPPVVIWLLRQNTDTIHKYFYLL